MSFKHVRYKGTVGPPLDVEDQFQQPQHPIAQISEITRRGVVAAAIVASFVCPIQDAPAEGLDPEYFQPPLVVGLQHQTGESFFLDPTAHQDAAQGTTANFGGVVISGGHHVVYQSRFEPPLDEEVSEVFDPEYFQVSLVVSLERQTGESFFPDPSEPSPTDTDEWRQLPLPFYPVRTSSRPPSIFAAELPDEQITEWLQPTNQITFRPERDTGPSFVCPVPDPISNDTDVEWIQPTNHVVLLAKKHNGESVFLEVPSDLVTNDTDEEWKFRQPSIVPKIGINPSELFSEIETSPTDTDEWRAPTNKVGLLSKRQTAESYFSEPLDPVIAAAPLDPTYFQQPNIVPLTTEPVPPSFFTEPLDAAAAGEATDTEWLFEQSLIVPPDIGVSPPSFFTEVEFILLAEEDGAVFGDSTLAPGIGVPLPFLFAPPDDVVFVPTDTDVEWFFNHPLIIPPDNGVSPPAFFPEQEPVAAIAATPGAAAKFGDVTVFGGRHIVFPGLFQPPLDEEAAPAALDPEYFQLPVIIPPERQTGKSFFSDPSETSPTDTDEWRQLSSFIPELPNGVISESYFSEPLDAVLAPTDTDAEWFFKQPLIVLPSIGPPPQSYFPEIEHVLSLEEDGAVFGDSTLSPGIGIPFQTIFAPIEDEPFVPTDTDVEWFFNQPTIVPRSNGAPPPSFFPHQDPVEATFGAAAKFGDVSISGGRNVVYASRFEPPVDEIAVLDPEYFQAATIVPRKLQLGDSFFSDPSESSPTDTDEWLQPSPSFLPVQKQRDTGQSWFSEPLDEVFIPGDTDIEWFFNQPLIVPPSDGVSPPSFFAEIEVSPTDTDEWRQLPLPFDARVPIGISPPSVFAPEPTDEQLDWSQPTNQLVLLPRRHTGASFVCPVPDLLPNDTDREWFYQQLIIVPRQPEPPPSFFADPSETSPIDTEEWRQPQLSFVPELRKGPPPPEFFAPEPLSEETEWLQPTNQSPLVPFVIGPSWFSEPLDLAVELDPEYTQPPVLVRPERFGHIAFFSPPLDVEGEATDTEWFPVLPDWIPDPRVHQPPNFFIEPGAFEQVPFGGLIKLVDVSVILPTIADGAMSLPAITNGAVSLPTLPAVTGEVVTSATIGDEAVALPLIDDEDVLC